MLTGAFVRSLKRNASMEAQEAVRTDNGSDARDKGTDDGNMSRALVDG